MKMRKPAWYPEDPMMEAVAWAIVIFLSAGGLLGFGIGLGAATITKLGCG